MSPITHAAFPHTFGAAAFAIALGLSGAAAGQFAGAADHTARVAQYSLSPGGGVDGLILADGTEAMLPPDAAGRLVAAVRPGDTVTVRGRPAGANSSVIDAIAVVNTATGELAGTGPFRAGMPFETQSTVKLPLHDAKGALNGALLADGTIVRVPAAAATRNAATLAAGQPLYVRGYAEQGPLGRVVLAEELGGSAADASQIADPTPGR